MTKWTTLCANFTDEEMRVIKQVQRLYKFNQSQLVRASVGTGISVLLIQALTMSEKSPLVQALRPVLEKVFDKKKMKEIEQAIEKIKNEHPELVKKSEEDGKILNESVNVFRKHNKRGAPKRSSRKRGRPKKSET